MSKFEDDEDLKDVLRSERSRGRRRRVDVEAEKIQRQREDAIRQAFRNGSEEDLRKLLELWDLSEEAIEEKIRIFRALRGEKS